MKVLKIQKTNFQNTLKKLFFMNIIKSKKLILSIFAKG